MFIWYENHVSAGDDRMENLLVDIDFQNAPYHFNNALASDDISPRIRIGRIRSEYLAIILEDIFGPSEIVTCWLIWNIRAREIIPEGIPPISVLSSPFHAVQGTNDFGTIGYRGPFHTADEGHTYYFNVYGLDARLDIPPGSDRRTLVNAMKGHLVQYGSGKVPLYTTRFLARKITGP